jgi:crotonobetainyl-CoA:carnitine CoA-transferase CaiB-like acyl-CoA transferase
VAAGYGAASDAPVTAAGGSPRPLDGVVVLELGQILAGPYAGQLLAAFGAEVIKVEPPDGGDPIRGWRGLDPDDGTSLWWRSLGRDKRAVAIDLAAARGQELVGALARQADVLIENFKPGTLERWGLGPERLLADNPSLIVARISGFGQSGPYAHRPGYASVCEAFGGLRHLTGTPGEPPVRANLSLGDSLAGLQAALGILLALRARDADPERRGQVIDVAIFEAVFSVLESTVPEYDRLGTVRGPSGTTITGIVPSNAYPAADGRQVVIGANNTANYRRLMRAAGRADLADDPELATNPGRVARRTEIDGAIAAWTGTLAADEIVARLDAASVPASKIFSVADMAADPHYVARELFERLPVGGREVAMPAVGPRLTRTPARSGHAGRDLGADTRKVLVERLGLTAAEIDELRRTAVIALGD